MRGTARKFYFIMGFSGLLMLKAPFIFCQQESSSTPPSWRPLLEEARKLENKGSYLEAKERYESLLKQEGLGRQGTSIRRAYEALQMKILFSKIETPDSVLYTVAQGDTLSGLSKKYGTTVELLKRSNGLTGDQINVGAQLKITQADFSIMVRKHRNQLILFSHGKPLKRYSVATGEKGSTPVGVFKVVNKLKNPTWFHAGLVLSPDSPQNILGSRWLGFDTPGYGIHGTTLPQTIGTQSSKGCIRMLNSDVEELYDSIPLGTSVVVRE